MTPIQIGDFSIRQATPADTDAAYHVCLATGDGGRGAAHLYEDPRALGHIFVGPYLKFEPELAFVLADARGVCGYVLGALDSEKFYAAYLERWLPELRRLHPAPAGNPVTWNRTQRDYHQYHHPDIFRPEPRAEYPSHLHLDLLPRAQGRGLGVAMMRVLLEALIARGSRGVHLGQGLENARAERFYRKLGFHELTRTTDALYLGRRLEPAAGTCAPPLSDGAGERV